MLKPGPCVRDHESRPSLGTLCICLMRGHSRLDAWNLRRFLEGFRIALSNRCIQHRSRCGRFELLAEMIDETLNAFCPHTKRQSGTRAELPDAQRHRPVEAPGRAFR